MRHTLDNGLTILLRENHAARVVAFQAWVNAGSADETDHEAGLAHLHEHMLFKGTARRGVGEIARDVEGAGGDINAWTAFDQTVFHLVMASRDFGVGLDILADALRHSAFDPAELAREKEVILEEIRRAFDMPVRRATKALFETAYQVHPYRRPVIGSVEAVMGHGRDDVLAFYRKHYRPEKVTLVLAGDFRAEDALGRITRLFEDWRSPDPAPPATTRLPEPEQHATRTRVVRDGAKDAYLELGWHIPRLLHPDVPALDVAAVLLGQGESSRLVHALRRRRHLANGVQGYAYTPKDPGLFAISAQCAPPRAEEVLEQTLRIVHRLREDRVSEDELEKAKHLIESDAVYQHETVQGQARRMGYFETVAGSPDYEEDYYRRVRRVTGDDLRTVAETYLGADRLTAVALLPEGHRLEEGRIESLAHAVERNGRRRRRPRGTDGLHRSKLTSGAQLIVQSVPHVPLVSMRGVFVGGLRYESPEDNGINLVMSRMLTSGTRERSAEEIARELDEWAGSIVGLSGRNSFGLGGEFLARHLDRGMRLFSECLTEPAYPEEEFEKERSLQLEELRAHEDDPAGVAFQLFVETLWQRHPYRMDPRGTRASLERLDAARLRSYHAQRYPISRMHLAVVGDVEPERARDLAEELFGADAVPHAEYAPPRARAEAPPEHPRSAERVLAKEQAHVLLGYPGVRLTDADRYPLEVLSAVLAGQGGRLFHQLRDRRSLAYSLTATSLEGLDPGYFAVYLGCAPRKLDEAVKAIRAELARVREEHVRPEELERVKRYLVGAHEIGLQRAGLRAAVIAFDDAYGVGHDAYLKYAGRIEKITVDDLVDVARRYLEPRREVLAVVRP